MIMRLKRLLIASFLCSASAYATGPEVSDCPSAFHGVSIHGDAKLCQIFDSDSPSSMVYHVKQPPKQAVSFFLSDNRLSIQSNVRDRTLIMSSDKNHRVIVSPDGSGSQIDILVITPQS